MWGKLISKTLDLIIPAILIIGCFVLLRSGIDGEVKSILALAAGWAFRAAIPRKQ